MTNPARSSSERFQKLQGPRVGLILGLLALVGSGVFLLSLFQRQYGLPGWTTEQMVEFKDEAKENGKAVRAGIPKKIRTALVMEKLRVFENGTELPRSKDRKSVVERGGGLFNAKGSSLWLSSTDGSDPSTNGKRYTILAPRVIPDRRLGLFAVLATVLLWLASKNAWLVRSLRDGAGAAEPQGLSPAKGACILFLGALLLRLFFLLGHSDYSDAFAIKGMPYSDARAWMELATNMYEGNGITGSAFDGQRPGYALLLGTLFLATGPSVFAAQILNVIAGALTVALVYLLGHWTVNRTVGVAAALGTMLMPWQLTGTATVMSAPPGQALTILSVILLWIACLRGKWGWFLVAGFMLALANLVRTYTITAFPLYGIVITVLAWKQRWGWKRYLSHSAILVAGIGLVMGPWILRQKLSVGVATLSTYSMDLLYGTAKYGKWDHQVFEEAQAANIEPESGRGNLHRFYAERFAETVKKDPSAYLSERLSDWWIAMNQFDPMLSAFRLAATLLIVFSAFRLLPRHGPLVAMGALLAVAAAISWGTSLLASSMEESFPFFLLIIALAISWCTLNPRGRLMLALLAATLLGGGIMSALIGNLALDRTLVMIHWTIFLIYLMGIYGVFQAIDSFLERKKAETSEQSSPEEGTGGTSSIEKTPFITISTLIVLGFALLGAVILPLKMLARSGDERSQLELNAESRSGAEEYFHARVADLARIGGETVKDEGGAPNDLLYAEPVILGDYRCLLNGGEHVGHWARAFEPRPETRTLMFVREGASTTRKNGLIPVNFPGEQMGLESRDAFVLVGVRNFDPNALLGHDKLVIEALGIAPYDVVTGKADFTRVTEFDWTPAAKQVLGRK